ACLRSRRAAAARAVSAGLRPPPLLWSQRRLLLTGHASLPKPTIAPPQIEQPWTGVIVRAPSCATGRAQQRSGRTGLSSLRPAPRSPLQGKASAIRSWPASDENVNLVLVALLHSQHLSFPKIPS